jgi:predicted Zn finger-like uncharacterized protein
MSFEINCPSCNTRLAVEEAHIGQMVRCPNCQKTTVVPDPRAPAAPVRAPERAPDRDRGYDDRERAPRSRQDDYDAPPRIRRDAPQGNGLAVASMVLGIISLLTWCVLLGIPGLICGVLAIIFGNLGKANPNGSGMATAGLIMGIIAIGLWLVMIILVFAVGFTLMNSFR